ncbi:S-(hydroxymethyl)glutathione synthase [Halovibrio variabilis]|uniref:S-(Hydroxymethyl)glutathione synthase n=1 Tax=Halovibrio variabilis TaxID=31910 RepID=A0A511UP51_9GAMM|nr:GFA family protein [Halovibrio variabilis]GEN28384.1 S-(hydroxymethyl)glutathione synthase [Halovibrio variabilis]
MIGECLCGEVKFEIDGALPNLYQCHCSLCRKTTGSTANAATFVSEAHFRWVAGQASIRSFQRLTGYRNDFCSTCGSSVPNKLRDTELMWVPAGLLDEETTSRVAVHLHLNSAAGWEQELPHCQRLDEGPESLKALHETLQ